MRDNNAKRNHQHYMMMERALRGISTESSDGRRRFNADELEGCSPLSYLIENWVYIEREYRIALEGWHDTFMSLSKDHEELNQEQLDSFIVEVMRVGGWNEGAVRDFTETC